MSRVFKSALVVSVLAVSACADKSDSISAAYVSPTKYSALNCTQLRAEAAAVSQRARIAIKEQDQKASNDAAAAAVGAILFWPALFMIKGDGASSAAVAQLKGEMQAIEAVNRARNCGITFGA